MKGALAAACAAVLVLGAACASVAGVAVPAPTSQAPTKPVTTPSRTEAQAEAGYVPDVRGEVDTGTWWERPCDLLTDGEAAQIGVDGEARVTATSRIAARCERGTGLEVVLDARGSQLFVPFLEKKWPYYAEAVVSGQPARAFSDDPASGCTVAVGLSQYSSVTVYLSGADHLTDPCGAALAVAGVVVERLKGLR